MSDTSLAWSEDATTRQAVASADDLEALLGFLRDARGFDFTGYKRTTLARRVRKRMQDVGLEDFVGYRDRLETDPEEFRQLFNTILINVTGFFRDPDAWAYLQNVVIPKIVAGLDPDQEIRVWSAGCSSGEEAYTLAIIFAEVLGLPESTARVKIYGTDVDDEALHEARAGSYSAKSLDSLPPGLRDRYFEPTSDRFVLRPDLRRRVIFGRHDITRDAPISRLDLLICRNALMYFNVEAQSQIIDRFHFALKEGGFLFLGKAEMLLSDGERFDAASMRQRIFRRRRGSGLPAYPPPPFQVEAVVGKDARTVSHRRLLRDLMIEAAPFATVGVDLDGTVAGISAEARIQFGLTHHDVGRPLRDLELSYRPAELRSLIEQAQRERRSIRVNAIERRPATNEPQFLDVLVQPLWAGEGSPAGTAVTFFDTTSQTMLQRELKRVREDLETAYEELQSTNEELETTNEELQSAIEELETTNEELQSTNEELETTNEELQSGNEELETMNEEMRIRSDELDETRTYLESVLASISAGVVVLGAGMTVRSWSRGAEDLWGLRSAEVHESPFFSLDFGLPTATLKDVVDRCVATKQRTGPVEITAVNRIGRTISCSVTCTPLDRGEGVVLFIEESGRLDPPSPSKL